MKKLRILVTGSNGQLGQSLLAFTGISDRIQWIPTDVPELDITNLIAVRSFVEINQPDYIINCAAYTAVDQAETEPETALLVNSIGPENLAIAAKVAGIPLIHISTDYVFNGQTWKPYLETAATDPQSVYGKTKLAGEQAILKVGGKVIIVRTSWLYSQYGKNFFLTLLKLGQSKNTIGVIADQIGSPTYAGDLASGIIKIIDFSEVHQDSTDHFGVYHFCNTGIASWYDFSKAIMEIAGLNPKVNPLSSKEYPVPAPRPAYSILDTNKFKGMFWSDIPYWRTSLENCYKMYNLLNGSI